MQIFLIKDLPGKGKAGEIINVNDGYGKNFLIKNGIGKPVDNSILTAVKAKQESSAHHKGVEIAAIKVVVEKLQNTVVQLHVKTGAGGKMFGSVTGNEIAAGLDKMGFKIDKKNLVFEPIKSPGTYKIKTKFNHGLVGTFTLDIIGGG